MRHQKKRHRLGRTAAHRKATLAALATALIEHKRIETTLPKAKALRGYVEPLITRAKDDSTANRRQVFRHLQSKEAVKELFGDVAASVGDRPGGYTRIIKLGQRQGDNAEMAVIELVDYNDVRPEGASTGKKRTRRGGGKSRRRGGKKEQPQAAQATQPTEQPAPAAASPSGPATTAPAEKPEAAQPEPEAQPPEVQAAGAAAEGTEQDEAPAKGAIPHPEEQSFPDTKQQSKPDAPQGADPGTGQPPPEAKSETQGRGGEHRG